MRARRFLVAGLSAVTMSLGLTVTAGMPASADGSFSMPRLEGKNRYETAAAIALHTFSSSSIAVLATGENFPDALAGNYLAGALNAPLLLVRRDDVTDATRLALAALHVTKVYVLGGDAAISPSVKFELGLK